MLVLCRAIASPFRRLIDRTGKAKAIREELARLWSYARFRRTRKKWQRFLGTVATLARNGWQQSIGTAAVLRRIMQLTSKTVGV